MTTPAVLRTLEVLTVAVIVVFLMVTTYAFWSAQNTFAVVGNRTAETVRAAYEVQSALADMDTNATDALLINDDKGRQANRAAALRDYQEHSTAASDSVVKAAKTLDEGDARPVQELVVGVGEYQRHIERALVLQQRDVDGEAVAEYRAAIELMHGERGLLQKARDLADQNVRQLDASYSQQDSQITTVGGTVAGVVVVCFVMLVASQAFLFRRTRRVLNVGLLAATLLLVAGTVMVGAGLSNAATNLKIAKVDAFDSSVAFSRARAGLHDMRGAESAYVFDTDHDRQVQAESRYLRDAQDLLATSNASTIQSYSSVAATFSREASTPTSPFYAGTPAVPFSSSYRGLLVDAYKSTSFPDERENMTKIVQTYAVFQSNDLTMRDPKAQRPAVVESYFNISIDTVDAPIKKNIAINDAKFNEAISKGQQIATLWQILLPLVALACIALVILGFRPRIAEYQRS